MICKMLVFFPVLALSVCAADSNDLPFVKVGSLILSNVYVSNFDASNAWLYSRQGGGGKFKLSDLPTEVQARCHYDPSPLAQQKAKADADALALSEIEKAAEHARKYRIVNGREVAVSNMFTITGAIIQVLHNENAILLAVEADRKTTTYENGQIISESSEQSVRTGQTVYVQCGNVSKMVDGQEVEVITLRDGNFTYLNTLNAETTVEKYIASSPIQPNSKNSGFPLARLPFVGDETPISSLLAAPRKYLAQPVIICGSLQLQDLYDYSYSGARKTHFSLDFSERTPADEPTRSALTIYAKRNMAQPLVDHILAGQKMGYRVAARLKILLTSRSFQAGHPDRFDDCAELVDWQFLTPGLTGWQAWAVEASKAAAQDALENKRLALTVHVVPIFQALADKGDADGQFRMGEFYRDGYGVPKDEAKARDYFTKSAAQGYKDAARALERLDTPKP